MTKRTYFGVKMDGAIDISESLCSPWRRWAARLLDVHVEAILTIFLFVYGFGLSGLIWIFAIPGFLFDSLCYFMGVWILDSMEYALFGNTLGKFLFGVRIVKASGEKAKPSEYMKRNEWSVWTDSLCGSHFCLSLHRLCNFTKWSKNNRHPTTKGSE